MPNLFPEPETNLFPEPDVNLFPEPDIKSGRSFSPTGLAYQPYLSGEKTFSGLLAETINPENKYVRDLLEAAGMISPLGLIDLITKPIQTVGGIGRALKETGETIPLAGLGGLPIALEDVDVYEYAINKQAEQLGERPFTESVKLATPVLVSLPFAPRLARAAEPVTPQISKIAPKPKIPVIMGEREIIKTLGEAVGVPTRVGRFRTWIPGGHKLGIFKPSEEIVRTKSAVDVQTAAHEVGHFIDKELGLRKTKLFDDELTSLGKTTSPKSKQADTAYLRREGVAEFTSLYVTDPVRAMAAAPKYFIEFESRIATKPEIFKALADARKSYEMFKTAPATAQIKSKIVDELPEVRGFMSPFDKLFAQLADQVHPIKRTVREIGEGKTPELFAENAAEKAYLLSGVKSKAESFIMEGAFDRSGQTIGPGLNEILQPVIKEGSLDYLNPYLVALRARELAKVKKVDIKELTGITKKQADLTIAEVESKFPSLRNSASQISEFANRAVEYLEESGVVPTGLGKSLAELYKNYIPFHRVFDEPTFQRVAGGGSKMANLTSPVKRFFGGEQPIWNPLQAIVENVFDAVSLGDRDGVLLTMIRQAKKQGGAGKFIERIDLGVRPNKVQLKEFKNQLKELGLDISSLTPDELKTTLMYFRPNRFVRAADNEVLVFEGGEPTPYRLAPELYESVMGLNKETANIWTKTLGPPARLLRFTITAEPIFQIKNFFRDQFTLAAQTRVGTIPFYEPAKMAIRLFRSYLRGTPDEVLTQFNRSGAAQSTWLNIDRKYLKKTISEVIKEQGIPQEFAYFLHHPVEAWRTFGNVLEQSTRMAEFKNMFDQSVKSGLTFEEALLRGGRAAQEVSVPFNKRGLGVQTLSQITAFLNPSIQGLVKTAQVLKNNPRRAVTAGMISMTAPSLLLYLINRQDPEYKELPEWRRDLFWNVKVSDEAGAAIKWISLPKPFIFGQLFATLPEKVAEWIEKYDPEAVKEFAQNFAQELLPAAPIPTLVAPLIEQFANRRIFTGRPIVPKSLEGLPPEFQSLDYTSEIAKATGELIGYSPAKIDALLRGYLGGLGSQFLKTYDIVSGQPDVSFSDFIRPISARLSLTESKSINRFYDYLNELDGKYQALTKLIDEGNVEKARMYAQNNKDALVFFDEKKRRDWIKTAINIGQYRKLLSEIRRAENLPNRNQAMNTLVEAAINEVIPLVSEWESFQRESQ